MCLAEFAATYSTDYKPKDADVGSESTNRKIVLVGGFGHMRERRTPAIIRFRKCNKDADASNLYRAKIMLYCPWYSEEIDLLGGFPTYAEHYEHVEK